jgi:adenylate cyclase
MKFPGFLRSDLRDTGLLRSLIALVALVIGGFLQWHGGPVFTSAVDEWLRDKFIQIQATTAPERRVLVIDVDESSIAQLPWPWPRARIADLVELALADGARGVALDILLEKPADAPGDMRLAMLAQHGPVVLAQMFDYLHDAAPLAGGRLIGGMPARAAADIPAAHGYLANHAEFAGARHAGNIGVLPDADGTLRRLPMRTLYQGRVYPTLALALVECCGGGERAPPGRPGGRRPS